MSGGRSSAYGFLYQYLATADYFLSYLNAGDVDPADVALLIEAPPTTLETVPGATSVFDGHTDSSVNPATTRRATLWSA
jgi:hypothetical protein